MNSRWSRAASLIAVSAAFATAPAHAFDTVDALPWPSAGLFVPAYEGEPIAPWGISAYAGTMYDTNVQRRPSNEAADWISRIGLGGRYAARVYGRQSIALDGYGEYRKYDEFTQYDHFAYGLRGQWLWELGNQLSGIATASRTHRLADVAETRGQIKNMVTLDRLDVAGAYRFHPDWRLTGGVGTARVANDGRDVDTAHRRGARGGLEYVSGLGNSVGVEARYAKGDAPVEDIPGVGSVTDNEYEENEVALTLVYRFGEQLRARGRLGRTEREYTLLPASNFSGTTGRGAIEWRPGIKTLMTFEVFREPASVIDIDALYADVRGLALGYAWAVTYKVVLSARYASERRLFKGDVLTESSGLPQRDETLSVIRLGLGWEPERRWQLGSSLDFGTRSSNLLNRDYDYTAVTVNLRYAY